MKNNIIIITILLTNSLLLNAQHNGEFVNNQAIIKVQPGAIMTVQGDMHNLGGLVSNDGFVEVQGNLYSDNTFQQRGTGTLRLQNDDVNLGERQFIQGSYAVRGGQSAIGVDDGSFFNLELANTEGIVYLVGAGNIADVRNSVNFKPTTILFNNIVTDDIGLSGPFTYPANGAAYMGVFGLMNPVGGNANLMNNTVGLNGNSSAVDSGYVVGKFRRAIDPAGGIYGYVMGLEPAATNAARGMQYIHLDFQANTYDVVEGYFQQGSLNNNTPNIECSGYQMDDFWGDRHGEWIFEDINQINGGDYEVKVWPQDPTVPFTGLAWTISKDDVFYYPAPDPRNNDCGPTPTGLDRMPFNGFSEFGVVSGSVNLPITLLDLTARPIDNEFIRIDWSTAQELNVDYFELQRSSDGVNFQTIQIQDAVGNSTHTETYSFDDYHVVYQVDYYYRIKTVDLDNSTELSHNVVAALVPNDNFQNVIVYPNPIAAGEINIDLYSLSEGPMYLSVFDAIGQEIYVSRYSVMPGLNKLQIDVSDWPAAAYFIRLKGENNFLEVRKFIKTGN